MQKRVCPKCGNRKFLVITHVTQLWMVDGNGDFLESSNDCLDVTHRPDDDDLWECACCGYKAAGSEFNKKEESV